VCTLKKGQILYEVAGLDDLILMKALNKARTKLPIKTKVVKLLY